MEIKNVSTYRNRMRIWERKEKKNLEMDNTKAERQRD